MSPLSHDDTHQKTFNALDSTLSTLSHRTRDIAENATEPLGAPIYLQFRPPWHDWGPITSCYWRVMRKLPLCTCRSPSGNNVNLTLDIVPFLQTSENPLGDIDYYAFTKTAAAPCFSPRSLSSAMSVSYDHRTKEYSYS